MRDMSESIAVRCPACGRRHRYTAPPYPCACGAPVAPPLDTHGTAAAVTHRTWDEEWVGVRCAACGDESRWPRPELGCPCGTVLCVPVERAATGRAGRPRSPGAADRGTVPIRTALDAVTAAVLYLRGLGHPDVRRADQRPTAGIGLAAHGILAQVDPTAGPASVRDVECLWLTAMAESAECVYFSLAGYADEARARAERLGVPLFVLGPTGVPRPVNGPARALDAGAG
ncbi:hypothetical protein H0H10_23775 [Streptomyces sp. TRM S81-3]|uniref:Restriction endonuclease type IV Mrr domain-containing protein n=1 Tax=Streptomyces griseicoloratus TaxID=2752516 RepID=A0A926QTK1_9ACTN|nr:hypothetical protein [Streptomyces griseicoloratus]MBD0422137.1 hypothetical protein [Streptomyces griseicoloratus]